MSNPFHLEDGPQPPKILTAPVEILANLRPLQANRIPLVIRFQDRNTRYQSFLVDIDRNGGQLALDEIIPNDGDRLIRHGEPFEVECFYEGARLAWENTRPARTGESESMPCHWISVPTALSYHQRRNAYRAMINQKIAARLFDSRFKIALDGDLQDISATGCRLRLEGNRQERLQNGAVYEKFTAQLPIGGIESAVELRHVLYDEKNDRTYCGLRFHQLSGVQQRHIERYVSQLQRESRRNNDENFLG